MGKVVQLTASIGKWFHKYIEFGKNDCLKCICVCKMNTILKSNITPQRRWHRGWMKIEWKVDKIMNGLKEGRQGQV